MQLPSSSRFWETCFPSDSFTVMNLIFSPLFFSYFFVFLVSGFSGGGAVFLSRIRFTEFGKIVAGYSRLFSSPRIIRSLGFGFLGVWNFSEN